MKTRFNKSLMAFLSVLSFSSLYAQDAVEAVNVVENKGANENIFWVLAVFGVFLIFAILAMSATIKSVIKSKRFKEKYKSPIVKSLLLLVAMALIPESTFASDGESILAYTRSDVWMLAIIDIVLLLVFFYLRGMANQMIDLAYPKAIKDKKVKLSKQAPAIKILTDVVPIEEEESIMMDHEYDGIRELDNNLPPWWKWGFYITVIIAPIYLFYYHVYNRDGLQAAEYEISMAKANAEVEAYLIASALNVDEKSVVQLTEPTDVSDGKKIFDKNCVVCHGAGGEGVVGPNLTDDYWIYEGDIVGVFSTVKYGAEKGMKSWKDELNPVQIQQVSSYILTLPAKEGKTPDGEKKTYN